MDEVTHMDTTAEQPIRPGTYLRQALEENGWCGRLLTPIPRASFAEQEPAEAFKLFTRRIRVGESFTLADLLLGAELFYGQEVVGKPGDGIYLLRDAVRDMRLAKTLLGRSVPGLYGLLTVAGGADLELPGGVTEEQIAFERLFLLRERDGKQLAESGVAPLLQVGTVVPDRLRVSAGGDSADLSDLLTRRPTAVRVGSDESKLFRLGYHAVLGCNCCNGFPGKYYVNLASGESGLAGMLSGGLGMFAAMMQYRFPLPSMRCNANGGVALAVPRPHLYAGDSIYVFQPKAGPDGLPLPMEYGKLRLFLQDAFSVKKIRAVLPLKPNAASMLGRMGGDKLRYAPEGTPPMGPFAMLGVLPAGETAPGTRIGHYEPFETEDEGV